MFELCNGIEQVKGMKALKVHEKYENVDGITNIDKRISSFILGQKKERM